MEKHQISIEQSGLISKWIKDRGGIAIWKSANLSNPGAQWITPIVDEHGAPAVKPSWQAEAAPARTITDPSEIEVVTGKVFKRFHVALRRGSQGFSFKLTDASSRRLRAAMEKAGSGAWYEFDYEAQDAIVFVPGECVPLPQISSGSEN